MTRVLVSGCGISFSGERPTWTKMLRILGVDIVDHTGPAISNTTILNNLFDALEHDQATHVVCQLTSAGKLDVDATPTRSELWEQDTLRNFTWQGIWPSSTSRVHQSKQQYYQWLYSPAQEQRDLAHKLNYLKLLCETKGVKLYVIQGYALTWDRDMWFDTTYDIQNSYRNNSVYALHDYTDSNTVPCRQFQYKLAHKINSEFLKLDIDIDKFAG